MLTLILERGRSVFDRFSLSVPCLVRPGLLQNVVRAARHSRSVSGGRGRMLASGDQVVGALQVGVARSMQSVCVRDLLRHSVVLFGFLGCVLACVVNAVAPAPRQVKQSLSGKKPPKPPRMTEDEKRLGVGRLLLSPPSVDLLAFLFFYRVD